jgi:hypothetical protein
MNGDHMKHVVAFGVALVLTACSTTPQTTISKAAPRVRGLLQVRISGDDKNASATAQFVRPDSLTREGGLQAQAVTVINETGVKFTRRAVNFLDTENGSGSQSVRNTQAIFNVKNITTDSLSNLTLYAVSVPNVTIGGTSIARMFAGNGSAITTESIARSLKPSHGMRTIAGGLEVQPTLADLQLVTSTEASSVQTQSVTSPTPIVGDVLEYGFVARNATYPELRYLGPGDGSTCPAVLNGDPSSCAGTVTLAYSFPVPEATVATPRSARLWAFTLYFIVADQSNSIYSQSLEEQGAGTVTGLPTAELSGTFRSLYGTSLTAGASIEVLCRVKTAIPSATNTESEYLGAAIGTPGCP